MPLIAATTCSTFSHRFGSVDVLLSTLTIRRIPFLYAIHHVASGNIYGSAAVLLLIYSLLSTFQHCVAPRDAWYRFDVPTRLRVSVPLAFKRVLFGAARQQRGLGDRGMALVCGRTERFTPVAALRWFDGAPSGADNDNLRDDGVANDAAILRDVNGSLLRRFSRL